MYNLGSISIGSFSCGSVSVSWFYEVSFHICIAFGSGVGSGFSLLNDFVCISIWFWFQCLSSGLELVVNSIYFACVFGS